MPQGAAMTSAAHRNCQANITSNGLAGRRIGGLAQNRFATGKPALRG